MANFERRSIAGVVVITPQRFGDERGFFSETFRARDYVAAGIDVDFVQDNHVVTDKAGVMRGLHYQMEPHAQGKLIRVARGAILDIVVDIRPSSPTFGHHVSEVLSAKNWRQIYAPPGLAHGYLTLSDDCEVLYKTTDYWERSAERGLLWSDPALGIDLPIPIAEIECNIRDTQWETLAQLSARLSATSAVTDDVDAPIG